MSRQPRKPSRRQRRAQVATHVAQVAHGQARAAYRKGHRDGMIGCAKLAGVVLVAVVGIAGLAWGLS